MKKFSIAFIWLFTFLIILPQGGFAYADFCTDFNGLGPFQSLCSITNPGNVVGAIITTLFILAIVITLFFLLWGGIRWITSGGDKAKIDQARGTLVAAVVGLVITFLSYFILNLVTYFVSGQSFTSFSIPKLVP
jgi:hypothetical protein